MPREYKRQSPHKKVECKESESSYMKGCRCDICRKAHTDRERERRNAKRARIPKEETKTKPGYRSWTQDAWTLQEILEARGGSW